ncbi:hypothetical protein MMC07_003563 [Pseudocyphellaria aurata]|nr:hypothetical protein [Pseudocyphellaria aurata]
MSNVADNDPADGWQVVKSKKRKSNAAKSVQAAANKSSEYSSKASATSIADLHRPISTPSTSKRRAAGSKAKRKGHIDSPHGKSTSEDTVGSEILPTSESMSSTGEISTTSPETIPRPSIGIPDFPTQAFAAASRVHVSPTRSQSSSDSASYVSAEQLQALETLFSSSESYDTADEGGVPLEPSPSSSEYDSAEEGGVPLEHSPNIPRQPFWTPTTQHETSSVISGASLLKSFISNPEISPTASKLSLWQPPKKEDTLTMPGTFLKTGTQDSESKRRVISQVLVSTDESRQQKSTLNKKNETGLRTTVSSTSKAKTSTRISSEKQEISRSGDIPPQSSSGTSAELSLQSPPPSLGAPSPVITDTSDLSNDPNQKVAVFPSGLVSEESHAPGHQEAVAEEDNIGVEGAADVVINNDMESSTNTPRDGSAPKNTQLSSATTTPSLTPIHEESSPSSSTILYPASVSASSSVDPQTASQSSSITSQRGHTPSSSIILNPASVSSPSTSVDPTIATSHKESEPDSSTHNSPKRVSASTTTGRLKISSTPSTATVDEETGPSSSFTSRAIPVVPASSNQELGRIPSSSTPTQHELTTVPLISIQEEAESVDENSASNVSATTSKMSSDSDNTMTAPTSDQPEYEDDETTPKPKFAQLAIVPGQGPTSSIHPPSPDMPAMREEGYKFANIATATIPAEGPSLSSIETQMREQAAAVPPRLNANEQALTGFDIVRAIPSPLPSRAGVSMPRAPQAALPVPPRAFGQPKRSHAIPIRAPHSSPGLPRPPPFARPPPVLPAYFHGISGVPSHYIPLQGALHAMFFDPVTNMFVGDGPPRATPERADGSMPCTTRAQMEALPRLNRPVNPEDALHIQTQEHIASINAAVARAAAVPPIHLPVGVAPTSAPTRPFERYFCRCSGQWLDQPHDCPEPPPTPFPSAMPILPGTVLGPEWMAHRLIVDERIYPGGMAPAPGSIAAWTTSAVGGGIGDLPADLPARWFAPAPFGTEIGPEPTAVAGGAWSASSTGSEGGARSASTTGSEGGAGTASPAQGPPEVVVKKMSKNARKKERRRAMGGAWAGNKEHTPGPRKDGGGEGGRGESGRAAAAA